MKIKLSWILILCGFIASSNAIAKGDIQAGKTKSASCAACHGADGNSRNPIWPKLSGQHASYLSKQLQDFKAQKRNNPTMMGMAMPLSDRDIADLSAYFSQQKQTVGAVDEDLLTVGEALYRGGDKDAGIPACMACHGPSGVGNPSAAYPMVSGQHAAYVEKTLKDFRSGTRANDRNRMMQDIAKKMTDAQIKAVASYVQGLQ